MLGRRRDLRFNEARAAPSPSIAADDRMETENTTGWQLETSAQTERFGNRIGDALEHEFPQRSRCTVSSNPGRAQLRANSISVLCSFIVTRSMRSTDEPVAMPRSSASAFPTRTAAIR